LSSSGGRRARTWHTCLTLTLGLGNAAVSRGEDGWRLELEKDGVTVELREQPTGPPLVRGTSVLNASPDSVRAIVEDVPGYVRFMPNTLRSERVGSDGGTLSYLRYSFPWPMADRESVTAMTSNTLPDGGFEIAFTDARVASRPTTEGVVRLTPVRLRWLLVPVDGGKRTRVFYECLGELGGNLPDFLRKKAWRREPVDVLTALAAEVTRRHAESSTR
jgi:hypothetical protein